MSEIPEPFACGGACSRPSSTADETGREYRGGRIVAGRSSHIFGGLHHMTLVELAEKDRRSDGHDGLEKWWKSAVERYTRDSKKALRELKRRAWWAEFGRDIEQIQRERTS